jgi:hypothetical protein
MKGKKRDHVGKKLILDKPKMTHIRCKSDNNIKITLANFFKKKIKFSSAFDYKGSKQFLNSKKKALQQIVIDDDDYDNSSNNDNTNDNDNDNDNYHDFQSVGTKRKKYPPLAHPKTFSTNQEQVIHPQSCNNLYKYTRTDNNRKKNKRRKTKTKNYNRNSIKRNFSSQELKMFEDKEIRKIKPIKKVNEFSLHKKIGSSKFFHYAENDRSLDSSLFNIVSQMQ